MTYYFISYMWSRTAQGSNYSECKFKWHFAEELSKIHPIKWLIDIRDEYTVTEENGMRVMYEYQLIGWEEIPKDIYYAHKDEVG